jgi:hypothetical protein
MLYTLCVQLEIVDTFSQKKTRCVGVVYVAQSDFSVVVACQLNAQLIVNQELLAIQVI